MEGWSKVAGLCTSAVRRRNRQRLHAKRRLSAQSRGQARQRVCNWAGLEVVGEDDDTARAMRRRSAAGSNLRLARCAHVIPRFRHPLSRSGRHAPVTLPPSSPSRPGDPTANSTQFAPITPHSFSRFLLTRPPSSPRIPQQASLAGSPPPSSSLPAPAVVYRHVKPARHCLLVQSRRRLGLALARPDTTQFHRVRRQLRPAAKWGQQFRSGGSDALFANPAQRPAGAQAEQDLEALPASRRGCYF